MSAAAGNGAGQASAAELRRLVREVLAEVLPGRGPADGAPPAAGRPPGPRAGSSGPGSPPGTVLTAGGVPSGVPAGRPAGSVPGSAAPGPAGSAPPAASTTSSAAAGHPDAGSWEVRIGSDADLREFALRVLKLADNPKQRRDLVAGRIGFRLAGPAERTGAPGGTGPHAVHRVDKGAVTERTVAAAAAAGARLVLGPRAVLTPLGKDKARALGVPIDKER